MKDNEIIKALGSMKFGGHSCLECKHKKVKGDNRCGIKGCHIAQDALDLINRQKAEIEDLMYKLLGVMHSVDKWLDGEELKGDEVQRACTMREKTLQITEQQQAEIEREHKIVCDYAQAARTIELYLKDFCDKKLPYDEMIADASRKASAEIERLTEENKKQKIILDGIEDAVHPLPFETDYDKAIKQAKSEAVREYVTKYKDYIKNFTGCFNQSIGFTVNLDSVLNAADFVADEMVGDE